MRRRSIPAMVASSIGLAGCSLVVDALGPYDSKADAGFCASQSRTQQVCSDFDEPNEPYYAGGWSSFLTGGGSLALQPAAYVSPPDSLEAKTPPFMTSASSYPTAGLSHDLVGTAGTVHLESQIRIDSIGDGQSFVGLAITQQAGSGPLLQAQLFLGAGSAFAQEQDNSCACTQDSGLPAFTLGTWHRFAIEVTFEQPKPSMTLWIDDLTTPALGPVALKYAWQPSPYAVQAGIGYIGGGTGQPIQAEFDDVVAYVR